MVFNERAFVRLSGGGRGHGGHLTLTESQRGGGGGALCFSLTKGTNELGSSQT